MRPAILSLFSALLLVSLPQPGSTMAAEPPSCTASRSENLLPNLIGPMVGASPVWMVDGGDLLDSRFAWGPWQTAVYSRKTLWVVARPSAGLRIEGRRLDASGTLRFHRQPDPIGDALVVPDPARESVIPGGASVGVMRAYAFIPSSVIYPSAGCWEFTVRVGGQDARIVRDMRTAPGAAIRVDAER
jgi:hypothetical protein